MAACLAAMLFSGCSSLTDLENSQEYSQDAVSRVEPGNSLKQTFLLSRSGLDGLTLWLVPEQTAAPEQFQLVIQILSYPAGKELGKQVVSYADLTNSFPYQFSFDPIKLESRESLAVKLQTNGPGVWAYGRSEDSYADGLVYQNEAPLHADLAFRLAYTYDASHLLQDLKAAAPLLWLSLPLAALLILPGLLLLQFSGMANIFSPTQQLELSLGISLAFLPLVMLWTTTAGVSWNSTGLISGLFLFTVLGLLRVYRLHQHRKNSQPSSRGETSPRQSWMALAILILIFAGALAVRLIMVRDLSAPAWVDSVHHGLLARLILDQGGFPATYAPFAEIQTASYHPGFHTILSSLVWLSGMDLAQAMLVLGQVLNAASVFSAYLFTRLWVDNEKAALIAAFVVGFLTPMPAYYTSWGRYTQLDGLLILPVGLALFRAIHGAERSQFFQRLALFSAVCAGLFLVHYRVALFLGVLLVIDVIFQMPLKPFKSSLCKAFQDYLRLAAAGILAAILALPWLIPSLQSLLIPKAQEWSAGYASLFSDFSWSYLTAASGVASLWLAGAGALLAILTRRRFILTHLVWLLVLFVLANLGAWRLPGQGLVNNTSVSISLFLPIAALGGFLVADLAERLIQHLPSTWKKPAWIVIAISFLPLSIAGASRMLPILNPVTPLFRQVDFAGMQWIDENLPEAAHILVNPAPWGYGLYIGGDGGYWIAPLTGRKTTPAALLYSFGSRAQVRKEIELIQGIVQALDEPHQLASMLRAQGIEYVYLGGRGGAISPQKLLQSAAFHLLYQQDGVRIFKVSLE